MKKILALILAFASLILCLCGCQVSDSSNDKDANNHQTLLPEEMPEDFTFSVGWGVTGCYYNSVTGELRKAWGEEYTTTCIMSENELEAVYNIIREMKIDNFEEKFAPNDIQGADPWMTVSLSVHTGNFDKTVIAEKIGPSFGGGITYRGKKYLETVNAIVDIIVATEEWKSLPEWDYIIG